MRKSLIYILILFCVSLFATQRLDIEESFSTDLSQLAEISQEEIEYSITEYTPEQSATRPTNVQVPSVSRTNSAHRNNSVNSPAGFALKSDLKSHNHPGSLKYLNSNLLTAGFRDCSSYFKSLCRLII
jgi:hypothetical protein